jgi:hypothetical protein
MLRLYGLELHHQAALVCVADCVIPCMSDWFGGRASPTKDGDVTSSTLCRRLLLRQCWAVPRWCWRLGSTRVGGDWNFCVIAPHTAAQHMQATKSASVECMRLIACFSALRLLGCCLHCLRPSAPCLVWWMCGLEYARKPSILFLSTDEFLWLLHWRTQPTCRCPEGHGHITSRDHHCRGA